ncbi:TRAP transporter substrate-binding protein DctP [Pseudogemmobacter sp. W21_MBD1_M6]|uniref:TRAP transporter substrate-binding protein DctP n=1 Tax=Pseudogemmobacter sp. W21_MBD1_M6 TaxID=3240271 RepID=UPI003F9C8480
MRSGSGFFRPENLAGDDFGYLAGACNDAFIVGNSPRVLPSGKPGAVHIDVSVFHSGTLYTDRDAIAALGTGAVHMVWPVSVNLESIAPEYGVVNLPFSLTDQFMQSEGAVAELSDMMSKIIEGRGIRVMGLMRTADLIFLFKEKAVTQPSDLSGERVRMTGGRVLQSMLREFGASPISMPATEMAAALMQGAIDGIFTSAGGWEMVGTNAAQTASYIPGLSLLSYTIVADDKWISSLPEDLRKVVVDTTNELVAMRGRKASKRTRRRCSCSWIRAAIW